MCNQSYPAEAKSEPASENKLYKTISQGQAKRAQCSNYIRHLTKKAKKAEVFRQSHNHHPADHLYAIGCPWSLSVVQPGGSLQSTKKGDFHARGPKLHHNAEMTSTLTFSITQRVRRQWGSEHSINSTVIRLVT